MPGRSIPLELCSLLLLAWTPVMAQDAAAALPAGYAGSEACAVCHDEVVKNFAKNRHAVLDTKKQRGWEGRACESCHGPGAKHAETADANDIRNPLKLRPLAADKACLSCHLNQPTNVGRISSGHARNAVSCVSCHNVHKTGAEASATIFRKASTLNRQCGTCHTTTMAEFQRPHRHPLPEGAMKCTDCHNPHGSALPRSIRTVNANEPGCMKCHADKRGPFVFEHAPMRLENCRTCHEPHGSANPRMLTRQEVFLQCLECHSNLASPSPAAGTLGGVPPAFHDMRSPRIRNCTICHIKVHGSNVNRALLR